MTPFQRESKHYPFPMQSIHSALICTSALLIAGCNAAMHPPSIPAIDVAPEVPLLWPQQTKPAEAKSVIPATATSLGVDNGIIAVINQKAITLKEFDASFQRALSNKKWNESEVDIYQGVLDNLIERQLLLEYAATKKDDEAIVISEEQIDAEIERIVKQVNGGWEGYRRLLEEEKLSLEDIRLQIKENFTINRAQSEIFRGLGAPSPKEIQAEYKSHQKEWTTPEKRDISLITVYLGDYKNDPEKGQQLIQKISESLSQGEDFAKIAKRYSDGAKAQEGGRQGWVEAADLADDISKVAFNLEAEMVSAPQKMGDLYFLVKCHSIQPANTKPFAEVQQELGQRIAMRQRFEMQQEFMRQLYSTSHIEKLGPKEYLKYLKSLR